MRESNLKIEKIQKSSNVAAILAKVVKIVCIVMAVLTIVTGCILIGAQDYINREMGAAVESGVISADEIAAYANGSEIIMSFVENGDFAEVLGAYMIAVGAMMICMAIIMHFVGKVFRDIKESYSPFRPEIVKSLKVAFVLITLLCLESSLLIGAVIGFSLWCVIHIFEYGCELQKQSDETL